MREFIEGELLLSIQKVIKKEVVSHNLAKQGALEAAKSLFPKILAEV